MTKEFEITISIPVKGNEMSSYKLPRLGDLINQNYCSLEFRDIDFEQTEQEALGTFEATTEMTLVDEEFILDAVMYVLHLSADTKASIVIQELAKAETDPTEPASVL